MDRLQELLEALRSGEITEAEQTELNELLHGDLDDLTDDQLAEVEAELVELWDQERDADTPDVEALRGLRDAIVSVRETREAREEAAEARAAEIDEMSNDVHAEGDEDPEGEGDDDPEAEDDDEPESSDEDEDDEGPVGEADETPEGEVDDEPEGERQIAADGRRGQRQRTPLRRLSEGRRRNQGPRERDGDRVGLSIVAAANVDGQSAGAEVEFDEVGRMFAHRFDTLRRSDRASGRFGVASFMLDFPEDRMLGPNAERNSERIDEVMAPEGQSLLASGGLCAPVEASYDLARIDSDERPLRDGLVRFGADRGGIRFIEPPSLSDVTGAVEVWTEATDQSPGEDTKDSLTITCGTETEVVVDAIVARAQVGNFSRMTFPEQFDAFWGLIGSQHARIAENALWDQMATDAIAATHAEALGATRDLLAGVDQAIAAYRFRNRMARRATLRLALPDYVRDILRADLARQLAGDDTYGVTDAQIDAWFSARNVSVIWTLDAGSNNTFGTQAEGGALTAFPSTVEALLFHEGAYLFLDGGRLDLGVEIRDNTLNDTNDVAAFLETFENVAMVGVESLAITFDLCASGESQGTVAATICGS